MSAAFVEFLVSTGRISAQTADRITRWAMHNQQPIGMIAVDHALVIGRQIDEILYRQRRSNLKFGQIAVELGYLSQEKVDILLRIQRSRMLAHIIEALALSGLIPLEDGISLLSDFSRQLPQGASPVT
jgi:hypothetical protein